MPYYVKFRSLIFPIGDKLLSGFEFADRFGHTPISVRERRSDLFKDRVYFASNPLGINDYKVKLIIAGQRSKYVDCPLAIPLVAV
ncbi:hypothetical protein AS148_11060 [Achromobacter xylosoxidans]|nr:hypothetical protein AS148_11060 [Achromobacter xylosoxidans]